MMSERPPQKFRQDVLDTISDLLAGRPDVVPRAMFGHPGFATGGKVFLTLYDRGIGLKLPEEQARAAVARPVIEPFRPYGKQMREWVLIVHESLGDYAGDLDLIEAAIAFVGQQASKPKASRGRRRTTG
jgi:TfoX/Sxy family transcriptional regulator of competence genes